MSEPWSSGWRPPAPSHCPASAVWSPASGCGTDASRWISSAPRSGPASAWEWGRARERTVDWWAYKCGYFWIITWKKGQFTRKRSVEATADFFFYLSNFRVWGSERIHELRTVKTGFRSGLDVSHWLMYWFRCFMIVPTKLGTPHSSNPTLTFESFIYRDIKEVRKPIKCKTRGRQVTLRVHFMALCII